MKIGLVGLPNSGKTTVFNALTRSTAPVTGYSSMNVKPAVAVVEVGDERVRTLARMYQPKKTTFATLEIVDFAGIRAESLRNETVSGEMLRLVREMDAVAIVVRNFVNGYEEGPTPAADLNVIEQEFVLADLVVAERRIEKIRAGFERGIKSPQLIAEEQLLSRIVVQLGDSRPVRDLDLSADQRKMIKGYQFLTHKPVIVIVNSAEDVFGSDQSAIEESGGEYPVVEFAGSFEMELAGLGSDEDARAFMEEMGIRESARDRLTRAGYEALGCISFFTVGEDEVRAWEIRGGSTAVEAAGVIHSDLARGFIRAECFHCDDLLSLGSEKAVKEKGLMRLEGKEYVVRDGDVLSIRSGV